MKHFVKMKQRTDNLSTDINERLDTAQEDEHEELASVLQSLFSALRGISCTIQSIIATLKRRSAATGRNTHSLLISRR